MENTTLKLVVGLGNPGPKYAGNRHNIGFMVLDALAARRGLAFAPAGGAGLLAVAGDLHLLKPLTYMNRSGEAIAAWSRDRGVPVTGQSPAPPAGTGPEGEVEPRDPADTGAVRPLIVCDDLALPLGSVRLRGKGSSGGQNGLESVIAHLGGEVFPRLRLGIGPLDRTVDPAAWPDYVLADFASDETDAMDELVAHAADTVESWLRDGLESTISRFNRRIRPDSD